MLLIFLLPRIWNIGGGSSETNPAEFYSESDNDDSYIKPGQLLGAVVHEIRNPLNRLHLHLKNSSDEDEELINTLDEIDSVVSRVESVFRDREPRRRWIHGGELFQRLNKKIGHDIELQFVLGFDWIYLDVDKIVMALENLIENSYEAYDEESGIIKVFGMELGPEWCFKVEDEAGGMNFDEAVRVSNDSDERNSTSNGMGLGLLIVRKITQSHGGRMVIESEPSAGTEITLTLPKVTASQLQSN